jgi:hypothetical protein
MYLLSTNFDPKFLKGERLMMICFNANQISLHFDSSTKITFEGEYIIEENNQQMRCNVFPLKNDNGLLTLIETEIEDAYTDYERKDLRIKFSNRIILTLIGSDQYESYSIKKGDFEILV